MRGSRVKQLRTDSNPKPGRIGGGIQGFEIHSPNAAAIRRAKLLSEQLQSDSGDDVEGSSKANKASGELHDESRGSS